MEEEKELSEEERKVLSYKRLTFLVLGMSLVMVGLIVAEIIMIFAR